MRVGKYIAALIGTVIMSCSNFTDIEPDHALTPNNAFKTMSDIELHLTGIYSGFQGAGYYALAYGTLPDMMSDNLAENVESLGTYRSVVDWLYVANDASISGVWATPYSMINDCNILLSNVDRFKETKEGQINRLKGQALAIRALTHFDLLRYFGQSYDRNSPLLGVPVKTESNLDKPPRNTVKEVYDRIYADLTQAKTLLASVDQVINSTDRSHIDLVAVNAIMARVAYYAKDYPTAISSATAVINAGYGLADRVDFPTIWSSEAIANEVIWSITYLAGDGYVGGDVFFAVNNRVSFKPSQNLLLNYNPLTDIRYSSYFSSTTSLRPGELVVSKYLGRTAFRMAL
ncbi:MAG: RagB/SusD family nutrient uptake outer membrane protein [Bacteroidota bacterium]